MGCGYQIGLARFSTAQPVSLFPRCSTRASVAWVHPVIHSQVQPATTARCRHLGPAGQPLRVHSSRCWLRPACHPGRGGSNKPRGSHDELPLSRVNWTTSPTPHDQTLNTTPILPRLPLTHTRLRYPQFLHREPSWQKKSTAARTPH